MGSSGCGKTTLISAIVGLAKLDGGEIQVFGECSRKNTSRFGFMPQETALIDVFTIRETIWFYGTIYGLPSEKIIKKVKFLVDLLELPDVNRLVQDCSGGQQRRISFAVALIHDPELLILDEPTVGVDPLLRSKIWDYLIELTTHQNVTVLLSTHYIEEAKQSTHVGIMRNGVLMVEDSPQNVLLQTGANHLDDAFLILSEKQEKFKDHRGVSSSADSIEMEQLPSALTNSHQPSQKTKVKVTKPLKAMLTKGFIEIFRNPQ
jgi:ABC-type multidrug transport system ATPase subunit